MAWPPISLNADKEFAHYIFDEAAMALPLDIDRQTALQSREGIRALAGALYEALAGLGVTYTLERYEADPRVQHIRSPEQILGGAREGTCLDLALLYAGLALGKELVPLIVALDGHALVALSLEYTRRTASHMARNVEGSWIEEGLLRDGAKLRGLVDEGHYIAIECTGFARSDVLSASVPEGAGRVDGKLNFEAAVATGRAQLSFAKRPFRFAVDVAVLRDRHRYFCYEAPLAGVTTPYRHKVDRLMAKETLFAGRDKELAWLDHATAGSGTRHAFVTGESGTGKTALLVHWVRRLLERPASRTAEQDLRVVYVFINRQAELDDQSSVLSLLCHQLQRAHGRNDSVPTDLPTLEQRYAELISSELPAGRRSIVVIDGLDEAEAKGWNPRFLVPQTPIERTHVVFSARSIAGRNWPEWLDVPEQHVDQLTLGGLTAAGVEAVLVEASGKLGEKAKDTAFVDALYKVSGGDPMYLSLLVKDLQAVQTKGEPPTIEAVKVKPKGLDSYLKAWWNDLAAQGKAEPAVRDLLGYLLVGRGALSREVLLDIDNTDQMDGLSIDDAIERIRRYVVGDEVDGFRLGHPRLGPYLIGEGERVPRIPPSELRGVSEALARWCEQSWSDPKKPYASKYVIGQLCEQRNREQPARRSSITDRMLNLVRDPAFRRHRLDEPDGLIHDRSDLADLLAAALDDPLPDRLPELAEAAFSIAGLQHTLGDRVRRIFERIERAAAGDLTGVPVLFQTLAPGTGWQSVMLLISCGLVALTDRPRAVKYRRALTDILRRETFDATVELLERRVEEMLGAAPNADWPLPYPPWTLPVDSITAETARGIVTRIGGAGDAERLSSQLDPSMIGTMDGDSHSSAAPIYLAERDSPWLVANAVRAYSGRWDMTSSEAEVLIARYIAAHAANPYREYRLRSLWGVLGAVLAHPDPRNAIASARRVTEAAAQPMTVDYREMLRLASLGLSARLGDGVAALELQRCIADAISAALRTESDTWGTHTRRLAALAEVVRLTEDDPDAFALLERAHRLPFGYAGFQTRASLALADAEFVCHPEAAEMVVHSIEAALKSAHNVQEARFCASTTASVRTIRSRWLPGSVNDLAKVVDRFAENPHDAEFSLRFNVGEDFAKRADHWNMLPIPIAMRNARTLEEVARDVFSMPIDVVLRLNNARPGDQLDEVSVPDPNFTPLLAARLSSEVLGRRHEFGGHAAVLIARLLPAAAADATTLDAVMARLALACAPTNLALVQRLGHAAPQDWMHEPIRAERGLGFHY
jgi:hypothetical protein